MNILLAICSVGVLYQFWFIFLIKVKNNESLFVFKFLPFIFTLFQLALILNNFGVLNIK